MKTALVTLIACSFAVVNAQVSITEVSHLDSKHYRVKTPTATYLYKPEEGRFSSLLDGLGNDWIAYQDEASHEYPTAASTTFRGLGNWGMTQDESGHDLLMPRECSSQFLGNQIFTQSIDGQWAWTWTFYEDYAKLEMTKTAATSPYAFLFRGPAGGRYRPKQTIWGTNVSGPNYDRFDHFKGSKHNEAYRWFYLNGPDSPHTFWMAQVEADSLQDHYSLLGSQAVGVDAEDGMLIAGFGLGGDGTPNLVLSNTFLIGFYPKKVNNRRKHRAINRSIKKMLSQ